MNNNFIGIKALRNGADIAALAQESAAHRADLAQYFTRTRNMYNTEDENYLSGKGFSSLTYNIVDSANWCVTGFFDVTAGQKVFASEDSVETTETAYFKFAWLNSAGAAISVVNYSAGGVTAPAGTVKCRASIAVALVTGNIQLEVGTAVTPYIPPYLFGNNQIDLYKSRPLAGKRWASLGDSITYNNKWQPYVYNTLGLTHINCGLGSTCLAQRATPEATLPSMYQDERLGLGDYAATLSRDNGAGITYNLLFPNNPDIITIMGGANDIYYGSGIGTDAEFAKAIGDKDLTTFKGAYSYIVEKIFTWKPTVRLLLMSTLDAHFEETSFPTGLTYKDFAQATKDVAKYYSIPCIDAGCEAGINKMTGATFLSDTTHPNALGGTRIAERVIAEMQKMLFVA